MAGLPLVSCIMPTRNRRRFVSQAIWYFLRQSYAKRELVVLDDGDDSISDLIPADPRIRYIRIPRHLTTSAKHNLAFDAASGPFIAHWDDDTWYSPERLEMQLNLLQKTGRQASGLNGLLHYQPITGHVWKQDVGSCSAIPHPGALLYSRAYGNAHRFLEMSRDGILDYLRRTPRDEFAVQDGTNYAVVIVSGSGQSKVNTADPCWKPRPFDDVAKVLAFDVEFYARLRRDGATGRLNDAPEPITLAATFMVYDGFGSMAEYLALSMAQAGANIQISPFRIDPTGLSDMLRDLWQRSRPDPDGVVLCNAWWGENLARFNVARDLFIKTVWETSRLPADWPARLNRSRGVIVPSNFAARVFRESGVNVPVEVVYEGFDPEVYPFIDRAEQPGLTTLIVGVLAPRKNFRQAVAAWRLAFANDPDARLILKARFQLDRFVVDDTRIQVIDTNEPTRGILHWYRKADVLLALGNEGFGLPLVEAMATGLPVIALNSEAQADVIAATAEAGGLVLPVNVASWEDVDSPLFGPAGARALPDVHDAARQLCWVSEHRTEAREMGRRASLWAHTQRNVWNMGPAVLEAIERHARTPRPLRKTYAMWVPGVSKSAGIAYYARNLANTLPAVRIHETPPTVGSHAAWRSPVLHVQYAPGSIDEAEFTCQIQAAKHAGSAIIVTEHGETGRAEPWEYLADALVAIRPADAADLRARWPHKRVELIPPGCPSWRQARHPAGGQTIAMIGDSGAEVSELAEMLIALPDARLLVFLSPDERLVNRRLVSGLREACRKAAAGPMRRVPPIRFERLPDASAWATVAASEALADKLSHEADVVICPDGAKGEGGGYLTGIALASGLPVVARSDRGGCDKAGFDGSAASVNPVFHPNNLAAGLQEILRSPSRRTELASAAQAYCRETSWDRIGEIHLALWRTVVAH